MVDQNSFIVGYLLGRRRVGVPDKPFVRTRPKMPKARWRMLAAMCFFVPAILTLLITSASGGAWGFALLAGIVGLVVGMYRLETIWERRQQPPHGEQQHTRPT